MEVFFDPHATHTGVFAQLSAPHATHMGVFAQFIIIIIIIKRDW